MQVAPAGRQRRSIKAKALQLLAQREQSRLELRRKLLRHAERLAADTAEASVDVADASGRGQGGGEGGHGEDRESTAASRAAAVDAALDWLGAQGFLCDERFVESRVHARTARFGNLRIKNELAQHGVALPAEAAQALAASEGQRAAAVRERRFAMPPADAAERGAQERFLIGRGFSPETVRRLMRSL